jgi:group I intron endonuclease
MWIYKITNIQNNKVYIGQTIRPVEQRFHRHMTDALNNILDTHFARAIRKYGKDSFEVETIDTAQTQDELNQKEQYWIRQYNSVNNGYNETDAISKCGGNTYQSKTKEEMSIIKNKLRETKLGAKNPMARKVRRINIETGEEDIFDTVISCAKACGIKNGKTSITERLNGKRTTPYKKIWMFEYYEE